MKKIPSNPTDSKASFEGGAWDAIEGTWRPLNGSFHERGLSIEWHEFHCAEDLDWSRSFHPESLEICLNFSGAAELENEGGPHRLGANELAIYTPQAPRLKATRRSGSLHRFLTIELSRPFLQTQLAASLPQLKEPVRRFLAGKPGAGGALELMPLPAALLGARLQFIEPPVPAPARDTWYHGRVLEILAQSLFAAEPAGELFCQRHERQNREQIEKARFLIERDLENPPSLEMLARQLGLSPFYLSRIFTRHSGVSIPRFLRMKRIEKAAELIRAGQINVTGAAMSVGYSSLSAFNKAFVEQLGCCPGLYPNVPIRGRSPLPNPPLRSKPGARNRPS